MEIKVIENIEQFYRFFTDKANIGDAVENNGDYQLKNNQLYVGVYEGLMLVGFFSIEFIRNQLLEIHPIFAPGFRGKYALSAPRSFSKWLMDNVSFSTVMTYVPEKTPWAKVICQLMNMRKVGVIDNALTAGHHQINMTLYQVTKEELANGWKQRR
ncbi:hypothetical protein ARAF_0095 [Arsenophonus endosymbiont of Aleurodicus floccissimus]|uniref:DUF2824 family protein n=1 Tax=Arsenophonus endosymbiont of Aleurodicus floccissimus TaxID=2152761 RepID=UPI000E6B400A|nr:DUF2824 family protein [Arsenophonus endosymbiont of Aleurodicus floccissimus]SPP30993.1 hypothetical protein ARAF_0095 [Arsenophonus endosymbiont of Aleurodicus floccissimus]